MHKGPLTLVDLFAGCGGLSLGFEGAGFEPILVSELNDSARATYLANRTGAGASARVVRDVVPGTVESEFDLEHQLLSVGDVGMLDEQFLNAMQSASTRLPRGSIDVVAGGPPCQGFSGIGHRRTHQVERHEIPSNHLYGQMIRIIRGLRPKAFVFENVQGLLSARWSAAGAKGQVWSDIRAAFAESLGHEYRIAWERIEARWYGVPQHRPRVILVGVRKEYARHLPLGGDLAFAAGLLPRPDGLFLPPGLSDVIGDLCDPQWNPGRQLARTETYPSEAYSPYQLEMRTERSGTMVRQRGTELLEQDYSRHSPRVVERFQALLDNDRGTLARLQTKKFAQRALRPTWGPQGPSITVTSLPDDYVHYAQPRSLTVRECARLQGFPDWYVFRGPRTTGGERRAGNPSQGNWTREVPKYTQIGNAVPVKLAQVVASHLRTLIDRTVSARRPPS